MSCRFSSFFRDDGITGEVILNFEKADIKPLLRKSARDRYRLIPTEAEFADQRVPMRMLKHHAFFLMCSTPLLCGCVPSIHDYHYLSFENVEGAKVIKWMNTPPRGVTLIEKVPREYEIRRPDYTIKILRADDQYSKKIYIAVVNSEVSKGYSIKDHNFRRLKDRNSIYSYEYSPGRCAPLAPPVCERITTKLFFSVVDGYGKLLGKETIPFEVKDGGWVFGFDAI